MILTKKRLEEIFKNNETVALWQAAASQASLLTMHVTGDGLKDHIKRIERHESDKGATFRKEYTKTNRDVFSRHLRPIDHIFDAPGSGLAFSGLTQSQESEIRRRINNVRDGYSARAWSKAFALLRYITDPMALVFMELGPSPAPGVDGSLYPTIKQSKEVHAGLSRGRRLEWVIFKTKDASIFRVVDDAFDKYYKWKDGTLSELTKTEQKEEGLPTYPNYLGYVPALIVSDLPRDGRPDFFASPIQDEVQLADEILREGSISAVYRFKFGFPLPWKYPEVCGACKGTKAIAGEPCSKCNGSGIKTESEPGDIAVHAWPDKENPEIKEKAGFVSPDLKYLEYSDGHLQLLETIMFRTQWGTYIQENVAQAPGEKETATGRFLDAQPVVKRLAVYAGALESIEKFILDAIIFWTYRINDSAAPHLGRRFLVESPDALWTKYSDARTKGAGDTALDDLLRDYFQTKLSGPLHKKELDRKLKELELEPGVHLTVSEAKSALPYSEYVQKVYFRRFMQLPAQKSDAFLQRPLENLVADLKTFAEKAVQEAIEDPASAAIDPVTGKPVPKGAPGGPGGPKPGSPKPAGATA